MRLNLGCGTKPREGWVNLDHPRAVGSLDPDGVGGLVACDLDAPDLRLPFEDDSFEEILASHVLEHIRNLLPLMQELHRVAKAGCVLMAAVPYGSADGAWEDPTHVRAFFTNSWRYFGQPIYSFGDYGYRGDWQPWDIGLSVMPDAYPEGMSTEEYTKKIVHDRNSVVEMRCLLRAVKPIRPAGVNPDQDICDIRLVRGKVKA